METHTIDGKLLFALNVIQNAQNVDAISTAIAPFGYDATALSSGMALYTTASDLQSKQKQEYGEQFTATAGLQLSKANANKTYMRHVKLARVALRNDRGAYEALQLSGSRKQSTSGWVQQAKIFYANALASADIVDKLSVLTMTTEVLTAGQTQVTEVETKLSDQLKEKGEAQAATQARDAAFDDLQDWMSDFVAIARIALENDSQLLEMLGIVEAS